MGVAKGNYRYIVVVYSSTTDMSSIASLLEYNFRSDAEEVVKEAISSGVDIKKIRVFKASECSLITKEVIIQDER